MEISTDGIQRLAFIKYLHHLGIEQTKLPDPLCSISILTFHDSVELFLNLISDLLKVNIPKETRFMQYWDLIEKGSNISISYKNQMHRLNENRVKLKHLGIFPSKQSIDEAKTIINLFFEENTKQMFGIEYAEISLTGLIIFENVKDLLKKAETEIKSKKFVDAIQNIALSFPSLIQEYELRNSSVTNHPAYYFGSTLYYAGNDSRLQITDEQLLTEREKEIYRHIETIHDGLQELTRALKILALGLDYKQYLKFISIVPDIDRMKWNSWDPQKEIKDITKSDVDFCFKFVIESSLKLQESDYTLKNKGSITPLDQWF